MILKVTERLFIEQFERHGRAGDGKNFTIPALQKLFSYYDDQDNDNDTQTELDPVGISGYWGEYTSVDLVTEYSDLVDPIPGESVSAHADRIADAIGQRTTVMPVSVGTEDLDRYLVASF